MMQWRDKTDAETRRSKKECVGGGHISSIYERPRYKHEKQKIGRLAKMADKGRLEVREGERVRVCVYV
jgi:hypothetical protein